MPETPPSQIALGAAIRYIRERHQMTQEDLAFELGVHPTYISMLERGLKDLRWSTVCRVAVGLGVPALELVAIAEHIELD